MTANDIKALLAQKYCGDPWYYFSEVADATGVTQRRWIDGIAVNVWPSDFQVVAHEIKVSRSDFLNEVKQPSKRAPFMDVSTQFYFVVPNGMIDPREVPEGCGLMYAQSGRIVRKLIAPQRKVESIDVFFFMSMIRQAGRRWCSPLFQYAGRELTVEDLSATIDRLVEARVTSDHLRYTLQKEAEAKFRETNSELIGYVDALRVMRYEMGLYEKSPEDVVKWAAELRAKAATNGHDRALSSAVNRLQGAVSDVKRAAGIPEEATP